MNSYLINTNPLSVFDPFFDFYTEKKEPDFLSACKGYMRTDIRTDKENYYLDVEVPGVNKNDIEITLKDGNLKVAIKKEEVKEDKKEADSKEESGYLHRERFVSEMSREFYVGDVAMEEINASCHDGVLTISFPKASFEKKEEVKKIAIQ